MGGTKKSSKRNQAPTPNFDLSQLLGQLESIVPEEKVFKTFELDYDKIETISDIVDVLRGLQPQFVWYLDKMPEQFRHLHEKNLLKEIKNDNI